VAPLHPWLWPEKPWERILIDFVGPFMGSMFVVKVYAHSKWPKIVEMTTITAKTTAALRKVFAANGLPK
jgi:hypothetical protein